MRSPLWFVLAGLIAVGGFVAGGFYMAPRLVHMVPDLERVVLPGGESLTLDHAGAYTLYIENKSFIGGKYYVSDVPSGVEISLTSAATGTKVKLDEAHATMTYTMDNRSGRALALFIIEQPGRYKLSAVLPPGTPAQPFVLAVGPGTIRDSFNQMFRTIAGFFMFSSMGLAIAGAIVGVVLWQRTKAKRAT